MCYPLGMDGIGRTALLQVTPWRIGRVVGVEIERSAGLVKEDGQGERRGKEKVDRPDQKSDDTEPRLDG
jgi:hypothetical protein